MLVDSVYNGTGGNAKIEHFQIAGKTSTAQKPSKNKGYEGYIPAFIGYPVNVDKRFVVYVYIDSPQGQKYYGNLVAAPIFQQITRYIIYKDKKHYKFAMKKSGLSKKTDFIKFRQSSRKGYKKGIVPDLLGLDKRSVINVLNELNIKYQMSGVGIVSSQSLNPGEKIINGNILKVILENPIYE
jgi:cell division protein FtsI (penicillin-binding protein 3)